MDAQYGCLIYHVVRLLSLELSIALIVSKTNNNFVHSSKYNNSNNVKNNNTLIEIDCNFYFSSCCLQC